MPLARLAVKGAPTVARDYNTLDLAAYRNDLWAEAISSLNRAIATDNGKDPTDFFFLAAAEWKQGNARQAETDFARGVDGASKDAANHAEWRMFWAEAALLLGRPGPVPTFLEAQSEPERAMQALQRAAAAGQLKVETLRASFDLVPLRGRADFQVLMRDLRSVTKPAR